MKKYNQDALCPKCGFSVTSMVKQFCDREHDLIIDKQPVKCNIKGEHLHIGCCCGYEFIVRPMDWEINKKSKKSKKSFPPKPTPPPNELRRDNE